MQDRACDLAAFRRCYDRQVGGPPEGPRFESIGHDDEGTLLAGEMFLPLTQADVSHVWRPERQIARSLGRKSDRLRSVQAIAALTAAMRA